MNGNKRFKKRIRFIWTCSDFEKHQHRTKLGAWWCGQRRRLAWNRARRKIAKDPRVRELAEAAAELNRELHGGKTLSEILEEGRNG